MLRHSIYIKSYIKNTVVFGLMALLLASCNCETPSNGKKSSSGLIEKRDENIITFVTINSPNTYYINSDREFSGLEYDLATAFSAYLDGKKQIEFIVVDSIEEVVEAIVNNRADIAAADLTVTEARKKLIEFSTPYQNVQQQVIYNKQITSKPAKNISRLVGKEIVVPASTSFVERLK